MFTAPARPASSCARPTTQGGTDGGAASRGGWLQRLNHYKQKHRVSMQWLDWQGADLSWSAQLVVNGTVAVTAAGCLKKQDARDSAARSFLLQAEGPDGGRGSGDL